MKNKKNLIGVIIILTVIIATIAILLYLFTDLFKPNKQLFYKYIEQTKILDNNLISTYNSISNKIKNNNLSYKSDIEIARLQHNPNINVSEITPMYTINNKGLINNVTKQFYGESSFKGIGLEILNLKYIRDDNTYAIGADNILTKYLAIENSNLKDLFTKFGVEDVSKVPDSISGIEYKGKLNADKEILKYFKNVYGSIINNCLEEEDFFCIKNEDKSKVLGLSLSVQEVYDIIYKVLDNMQNDNVVIDLIIDKYKTLKNEELTEEEIKNVLEDTKKQILSKEVISEKDFFKYSITIRNKKVESMKLEFNFPNNYEQYDNLEESFNNTELIINLETNLNIELYFSELNQRTITIKQNSNELFKIRINYNYDSNNLIMDVEANYYTEMNEVDTIKFKHQINNYQTDNINETYSIEISSKEGYGYQINVLNNILIKQDMQITKLTAENSAKLNDMTTEELEQLSIELSNRINELYGEKLFVENSIIEKAEKAQEDYEETLKEEQEKLQQAEQQLQGILNNAQ